MLRAIQKTFAALNNRQFRHLWLGSFCAFMGFFTSNVVQGVVAFDIAGANSAVGFVVFGRGLAQLALGPVGGALADRISKRAILVVCQSLTTLVFFGLAALMASGAMRIAHLTAGGFLVGLTFAFLGPTRSAYVVELVERERQSNAIALNQVALNASRVIGPALGGLLLAWPMIGATGAFVLMGVLYALAVLSQARLPASVPAAPEGGRRGLFVDVLDGLSYVRNHARLRTLVGMFMLIIMLGMPHVTVLPGLCENQLHVPTATVSVLFGVSAAGGLLSSLFLAPLADSPHAVRVYVMSGVGFGLSLIALMAVEHLWSASAVMFVLGVTSGGVTTMNGPVILMETDPRYMGRVMSLTMLSFGASGLIGLPVGALADRIGEGATLAVAGALMCVVVIVLGSALARQPATVRAG